METLPEGSKERIMGDKDVVSTDETTENNNANEEEQQVAVANCSQPSSEGLHETNSSLISQDATEDKPPPNFAMAIVVSLLCPGAFLCGIAALVCGLKVRNELKHGDIDTAYQSSKIGKMFITVGYITTAILLSAALLASITYEVYRLISVGR
ncbi:uncharacterized protein [Apostichopus japonicus]|uniref:uncharacterized protein n=1 Tax=Stichopus japonicus TaxID=307972 RepID=UPI003AB5A018